ncbi:tail fiber protein [Chryseobacterium sp. JJR-5R]|uniref:tail fiber protein n=1 Tax=Chryseobacterium sp. JJR-5R TaxID=3093923 RepID=UPI002A75CE63|nr:tail fiber protein [Chryseobacterium sp. JJR-5R]WPO83780.1 tail fiber protein [Chryseobacterium sp. JJR-5R]
MSEKLNVNDFKSDHGEINRLELNEGTANLLTVEFLRLKSQIEMLANELKIIKSNRELININLDKTEVKNSLYANNEWISVPIGTIVAFGGQWIPDGWELCDGGWINDRYPDAKRIIGGRKPNLINRFIRGTDSFSVQERGSDNIQLIAENLPFHNHVYYEPRIVPRTKWGTYGANNNDALYNSHIIEYDKRVTHNNIDPKDPYYNPSRLEGRSFSIVPAHVTLRYIIKLK